MPEDQNKIPPELLNALGEALKKSFDDAQKRPDQYVVAYKRQDNDEAIRLYKDKNKNTMGILANDSKGKWMIAFYSGTEEGEKVFLADEYTWEIVKQGSLLTLKAKKNG